MYYNKQLQTMIFYSGNDFETFTNGIRANILKEIESEQDGYILNVNIDDYTAHLVQKYTLDSPEINIENATVGSIDKDIRGSEFPRNDFYQIDGNKTFKKEVFIYHIPYTGDIGLLRLRPNPSFLVFYNATLDTAESCIVIEVINFYDKPEMITRQYKEEVHSMLSNYYNIQKNCTFFNNSLEEFISRNIESRRERVLKKNSLLDSLGVPIRKKEGVAETFAIPKPKLRNKIIVKPEIYEDHFKPEPALDNKSYQEILKTINDVGKNFERLPSTYKGKCEEDIRDHIILILDPNFELGSVSGETFNKTGKTDILLRYDSSVVFVGECKYWKGEKMFLKTIDQLLGYLTWRNSKVAVINFVQSNEFSEILDKVKTSIKTHPNFVKELKPNDETWFNYKFHINGDRNRLIDLAVISFHLPK